MFSLNLIKYIIGSDNDFENLKDNQKNISDKSITKFNISDFNKIKNDYGFLQKIFSGIETKIKFYFQLP